MKCDKCGFNATVEQLHSVRLENKLNAIKEILRRIIDDEIHEEEDVELALHGTNGSSSRGEAN